MKFLIDANLPPRLCAWLKSRRYDAEHLFDLNLLSATDTDVWRRGEVQNLVLVSKDVDFYDRALLFGMFHQYPNRADNQQGPQRVRAVLIQGRFS